MSLLRAPDERPISPAGWLALYALVVAAVLSAWHCSVAAYAAGSEEVQTMACGRGHTVFCGWEGTVQLTPSYAQRGPGAVVTCTRPGGAIAKEVHLQCAEPSCVVRLESSGSDPGRGPYLRTECTSGGRP